MRRRRGVAIALGAIITVIAPLSATADVIEPYEEEDVNYDERYACAGVSSSSGESYGYTAACGYVESYGDDSPHYAAIEVLRRECTFEGSFETCTETYGFGRVDPSAISVDLDAGTGSISGTIDDCGVDLQLVGTDGDSFNFSYYGVSPGVRTRDLSIRTHRGWEFRDEYQYADATGSVCDWFSGQWDDGEIGQFTDLDREAGFRLNPEDVPGAGGAFSRGERPADSSAAQYACGYWDIYTAESDTYIDVCADSYDRDDDGDPDTTYVSTWRMVCGSTNCQAEGQTSTDGTLSVDLDDAVGHITGSLDACAVDVALQGEPSSRRGGSYDGGYDSVGPGSEPGEVTLGYSTRTTYEGMYASPADGAVACDWTEIADADWTGGFMEQSHSASRTHHLKVDPAGIEP